MTPQEEAVLRARVNALEVDAKDLRRQLAAAENANNSIQQRVIAMETQMVAASRHITTLNERRTRLERVINHYFQLLQGGDANTHAWNQAIGNPSDLENGV